ncbi:MAG: TonB-dependent receptor [Bacteroidota bacterium]
MVVIQLQSTLFLLLVSITLFSQEYNIHGFIVDSDFRPLEMVTISVFQQKDFGVKKQAITDVNGNFSLTLPSGSYVLRGTFLENKSDDVAFIVNNDEIDLGTIVINTITKLQEVAVTQKKPRLERKADRYIFNVQETSMVNGSITDLLSRTPGLFLVNDQLTYKGDPGVGIMINNKLINLPQDNIWTILKNAPAGTVESVEVITAPSAAYSAEGATLINIVMKGNLPYGYNGSVTANLGQGDFPKYTIGTDHNFNNKTMGLTLSYSYNDSKGVSGYVDRTQFIDGSAVSIWNADQRRIRNTRSHNINAFFDWALSKRSKLSLTSINQQTPEKDQDVRTDTDISGDNSELFSTFFSENDLVGKQLNSSSYLDFDHKFKDSVSMFSVGLHFTYFEKEREQEVRNDFFDSSEILLNEIDFGVQSGQQIRIVTGQIDFKSKLGAHGKYSSGAKFAGINSNSALRQNGTEVIAGDNGLEDGSFDYKEHIYALYGNMNLQWQKTAVILGLRTEYTKTEGLLLQKQEIFKNNYLEWFPNFSFKHELTKERSIILYYYRRITRPRYDQINPFQLFQGFNSTVEGNPRLRPATRHYLAGGYNFNESIGFELFYRYRRNQLRTLTFQDNTLNLIRFINANVDRELGYGIDFIVNQQITKQWQTYIITSYYYLDNRFQDPVTGLSATTSGWTFGFTGNNSFTLLADGSLSVDLDIQYQSPITFGNTSREAYASINLSFQKKLWGGKGNIGAGITDIFSQTAYLQKRRFLDQNNTSFIDPEVPLASFNFRYRFGNTSLKSNKKSKNPNELNRL